VLDLSADVATLLAEAPTVPIRVNLTPATPAAAWAARFDGWQHEHGKRLLRTLLAEHLPASLAAELCRLVGAGREEKNGSHTEATERTERKEEKNGPHSESMKSTKSTTSTENEGVRAAEATSQQRRALAAAITGLPFMITATEGFGNAVVTRGGVALAEVDPRTLRKQAAGWTVLRGRGAGSRRPVRRLQSPVGLRQRCLAGRSAAGR